MWGWGGGGGGGGLGGYWGFSILADLAFFCWQYNTL